ncbi:MAG TPA: hypothetical protein D7H83_01220 [Candidatus Poseidoniales archaeon]|jgi:hypothetical protein|nr:MAG TPA: hypothetical protein D7H83_01220 [Candidatus Poseidoniales archaeon]HIH56991.1 hypothetical protein [Candidatus Poseidoniaceae archaeon]|tara:strand:+ start:14947 stop:15744 length:798 start_codon:yes stop_codon:yes gene_type:complete
MNLDWQDIHWEDPDGGTIVLHGVLPTVVLPNGMRPRLNWHGLGIMGSSEEIEVWAEEEKSEAKDSGINLDSAILNGGLDGLYLEMLAYGVEGLQVGKFPDPEPRRLHKAAVNHERPVFFAEPDMDDEDWAEFLGKEARAMTRPLKLARIVFTSRRWRKGIKKMRKHVVEQPPREPDGLQAASALAATWWQLNRENSEEELNHARDSRFASRLRGAIASLRAEHGNEAVLLVPIQQAWRSAMLTALESLPDAESSSHDAPSDEEEE